MTTQSTFSQIRWLDFRTVKHEEQPLGWHRNKTFELLWSGCVFYLFDCLRSEKADTYKVHSSLKHRNLLIHFVHFKMSIKCELNYPELKLPKSFTFQPKPNQLNLLDVNKYLPLILINSKHSPLCICMSWQ